MPEPLKSVIVGTAGHIDHGKSTLVEALTGTHPDRLEEEKRDAERDAMTSSHMLQQLDSEMSRVNERLQVSQIELRRLASDRSEHESILCSLQSEIETLELKRVELEQQLASAQVLLTQLRQRREESAQTTSQHAAAPWQRAKRSWRWQRSIEAPRMPTISAF